MTKVNFQILLPPGWDVNDIDIYEVATNEDVCINYQMEDDNDSYESEDDCDYTPESEYESDSESEAEDIRQYEWQELTEAEKDELDQELDALIESLSD